MPMYHFHTSNGSAFHDKDGTELPDVEVARTQAVLFLGTLLNDDPTILTSAGHLLMTVTDDDGVTIFEISVAAEHGRNGI